jgi:DNA-binding PadR family transcriptional regulator
MINAGPLNQRRKLSSLQLLVLLQLTHGEKYGYEILKNIKDAFEGNWDLKTGTFYPTLKSMEKNGLIKSDTVDETDFYSLTPRGMQIIESFGDRFTTQRTFMHTFFRVMLTWFPEHLQIWLLSNLDTLAANQLLPTLMSIMLKAPLDKKEKLKILDRVITSTEKILDDLRSVHKQIEE